MEVPFKAVYRLYIGIFEIRVPFKGFRGCIAIYGF